MLRFAAQKQATCFLLAVAEPGLRPFDRLTTTRRRSASTEFERPRKQNDKTLSDVGIDADHRFHEPDLLIQHVIEVLAAGGQGRKQRRQQRRACACHCITLHS